MVGLQHLNKSLAMKKTIETNTMRNEENIWRRDRESMVYDRKK